MRTIIIAVLSAFILSFMPSCAAFKSAAVEKTVADIKRKCPDSGARQLPDGRFEVSISCVDTYDSTKIAKYIDEGNFNWNIKNGEFHLTGISKDRIPDIIGMMKEMYLSFKKKAIIAGVKK